MYDVIVIGGGPSGLMASIEASKRYNKVLLIEKNSKLGVKLLASGNGRCNVTNLKTNNDFIKNIQSSNPKFLLSSLSDFGPWDIYDFFADNNCLLKEEDDNRAFPCSDKSSDILDVLLSKLDKVEIKTEEYLIDLNKEDKFSVTTNKATYVSSKVILATGGLSYPNLGTTGDSYPLLEKFNLKIEKLYPALTALNSTDKIIIDKDLLGITINDCNIYYNKLCLTGNVLFTHFGVSGPGIFKVSEHVIRDLDSNKNVLLKIDLLPNYDLDELIEEANLNPNMTYGNLFKDKIFNRVIKVLLKEDVNKKINSTSQHHLVSIIKLFKEFSISIHDSKGFKTAFVTSGGLSLSEVNPKTMEVKNVCGLFVTGELLDLHAYTGGYNITIALSTGNKAGSNC